MWPLIDVTKLEVVELPSPIAGYPRWRPGPALQHQIVWSDGQSARLFEYETRTSTILYTGTGNVSVTAVRPDGSAVLLAETAPYPQPTRRFVVDLVTRQTTSVGTLASQPGTYPLPIGVLLR